MMFRKSCLAVITLLALVSAGCQTPVGGGYPGGCGGGPFAAGAPASTAYAPAQSTYASTPAGYDPAAQPALPPAFNASGSGLR